MFDRHHHGDFSTGRVNKNCSLYESNEDGTVAAERVVIDPSYN
jgi:hypothetical protein